MQLSIEERNMLRDFLRQQVSRIVSLARRDKGFLILLSEGLTREAGQLVSTNIQKGRHATYVNTRKDGNHQVFSS